MMVMMMVVMVTSDGDHSGDDGDHSGRDDGGDDKW